MLYWWLLSVFSSFSFLKNISVLWLLLFVLFCFSVLITSNVLLQISNWDINVKSSALKASSPSFHLLESCILFPYLSCSLSHMLGPCYSNLFSALKLMFFVSCLARPKKNEDSTSHQPLSFSLACAATIFRHCLYSWVLLKPLFMFQLC